MVATTRPISTSPPAVAVTELSQVVALPAAIPPVVVSSNFHTTLPVAGLNATSRAKESQVGEVDGGTAAEQQRLLQDDTCGGAAAGDADV